MWGDEGGELLTLQRGGVGRSRFSRSQAYYEVNDVLLLVPIPRIGWDGAVLTPCCFPGSRAQWSWAGLYPGTGSLLLSPWVGAGQVEKLQSSLKDWWKWWL